MPLAGHLVDLHLDQCIDIDIGAVLEPLLPAALDRLLEPARQPRIDRHPATPAAPVPRLDHDDVIFAIALRQHIPLRIRRADPRVAAGHQLLFLGEVRQSGTRRGGVAAIAGDGNRPAAQALTTLFRRPRQPRLQLHAPRPQIDQCRSHQRQLAEDDRHPQPLTRTRQLQRPIEQRGRFAVDGHAHIEIRRQLAQHLRQPRPVLAHPGTGARAFDELQRHALARTETGQRQRRDQVLAGRRLQGERRAKTAFLQHRRQRPRQIDRAQIGGKAAALAEQRPATLTPPRRKPAYQHIAHAERARQCGRVHHSDQSSRLTVCRNGSSTSGPRNGMPPTSQKPSTPHSEVPKRMSNCSDMLAA